MLCTPPAIAAESPVLQFLFYWMSFSVLGLLSIMFFSGSTFFWLYCRPTYNTWKHKSNPKYPSAAMVRQEVLQMLRGIACSTLCPSLAVWLSHRGFGYAYCGVEPHGWGYLIGSAFFVIGVTDFMEWFYHYLGHAVTSLWKVHAGHHVFSNPSPFAVIADEPMDQFMRSSLMLVLPMLLPINVDMMFGVYAVFFYMYGVYLHTGFECEWIIDAHHPIVNTAFQHYIHHARGGRLKAYHTGFFLKIWDQLTGTMFPISDPKTCPCVKCCVTRGERTEQQWSEVKKTIPSYAPLMSPSFWISAK
eukprot:TRINITY_DN12509_c0_g1_i1.p1 TRINITY_DN12509_c0_g1~~TRINITY_DN12509_c0_g1_i1.p1  ORF type:complete len:302 (-),score=44.77 TRINITY_DN12509_c0_g1_i1:228-1133(-)